MMTRTIYRARIWQDADGLWRGAIDSCHDGEKWWRGCEISPPTRNKRRLERRLARGLAARRKFEENVHCADQSFKQAGRIDPV